MLTSAPTRAIEQHGGLKKRRAHHSFLVTGCDSPRSVVEVPSSGVASYEGVSTAAGPPIQLDKHVAWVRGRLGWGISTFD